MNIDNLQWQRRGAFLLIILVIFICYWLYNSLQPNLAYAWVFGLLVGFTLQRSRICFTATLRDPLLFGLTELARAIILSLMITTVGYAVIQYHQIAQGLSLVGRFIPLGWHIPIGALIFGIGAAISGGCASGTLVRLGEGFQLQLVVFIGFIIGSVHGAYDASWWYKLFNSYEILHLPSLIGWWPSILVQFLLLGGLYVICYLRERRKFSEV